MSDIKHEIIKMVGVLSKSASGWERCATPQADTSKWEEEISPLVASRQLYGLAKEEIVIVEERYDGV